MEATVTVESKKRNERRVLRYRAWDDWSSDRAFLRIVAPARSAGIGWLSVPPNVWGFVPDDEEIRRIADESMLEPWMQTDFTNDDMLNGWSDVDDYDHRLLEIDDGKGGKVATRAYVLESTPHAGSAIAWARMVSWIDVERGTPLRREYFDDDGALVRTLVLSDFREVGGRQVPHVRTMSPVGDERRRSRIVVDAIGFPERLDGEIFTTRNLTGRSGGVDDDG